MGLSQGFYIGIGFFLGFILAQKVGHLEVTSLSFSLFMLVVFIVMGVMLSRGSLFRWMFRFLRSLPFMKSQSREAVIIF